MASAFEAPMGDDDLSRQRRKREAKLLDEPVTGFPGFTVADVVAEVLAASDQGNAPLNVPAYLADQGHDWHTIEAVVGYLQRHGFHPAGPVGASTGLADVTRLN
jgi:hypothetical protein